MNYIGLLFKNPSSDPIKDALIQQLGEINFDGFMDTDEGFYAYCKENDFSQQEINELLEEECFKEIQILRKDTIPDQNWNAEWEKSYEPAIINEFCRIRAPFHPHDEKYKYDIVIEPKMSFGTAHHETTSQIINMMFVADFNGKKVLDMGCGTAVLAILASILGAKNILAIDNDEWAYHNALDNVKMNNRDNIEVILGDASALNDQQFDIILANINRNILLNDMNAYAKVLKPQGEIFFSGFYEADLPLIQKKAEKLQLRYADHIKKNEWTAAKFIKE